MSKIAIRPYFTNRPNMGLEKYKQVLFDGVAHKLFIWDKEDISGSGRYRFITGLNELAPELENLPEDKKKDTIKQIRTKVAFLEGALASNKLDIKSSTFLKDVKMVRPENTDFWKTISVSPSNDPIYLDPTLPEDLIIICAIEAGGFGDIAPSLEAAKKSNSSFKFYLDKYEDTAKENASLGIKEDKAKAVLIDLYDNNVDKLFYVCKAIDPNSVQYKKSTPKDVLYGSARSFIESKEGGPRKDSIKKFTEIAQLDMETLKLRALIKDASFYSYLTVKLGQIYEAGGEIPLGQDVADVVEFLKNPLNSSILQRLLERVEKNWNE